MTAPDVQLTLCPISKAMSTVAMNIFCYLYDPINFMKHGQSISSTIWSGRLCRKINELKSYDELQQSIGNKFYRTIAVVRDPLSRFISGYLDKCVRPKRKCFGCDSEDVFCVLTRLKMALINKPEIPSATNITFSVELLHMAPQTWYCEMRKVFESLIFVKYGQTGYEHERMIKELAIAFTIARVPSTQVNYIENELKS
ncbi:unnamed protein product [Auanema sp. JU1783]|nr:unnamed protein product [Auanema sp. JU1783]